MHAYAIQTRNKPGATPPATTKDGNKKMNEMLVDVFEVYSEGGSNCILFLTEKEAQNQTLITPADGPYPAKVTLSTREFDELRQVRHMWA
jgi:hypothetical protein